MGAIGSQITSLTIVYSTVYSDADQRKHQSSTSLAFVWGIHRWPVNSPHKWPVTPKMFPFDDVIMRCQGSCNITHIFLIIAPMIFVDYIDGLVQDCSNSSALAVELLQSCAKPSIYSDVGEHLRITVTSYWARWRLKAPVSRLFTQPFVQAQINENIKALRHWLLWGEFTGDRWFA